MANSLDAYIPEVWAQEALMILDSNLLAANLIHRDFEDEIATFGDVVNTRRPAQFTAVRKVDGDAVTNQNATATNVAVRLDQNVHTSFIIYDGEQTKSFKSLIAEYLAPAVMSMAQFIDQLILYQMYDFVHTNVGRLGTDPSSTTLLSLREKLNTNLCPMDNRNLIVTPGAESALLGTELFVSAEKVGDEGTALREGSMGRKYGINCFMSQNAPVVATGSTVVTGAINYASGYSAGETALTVNGFSAAITNGAWCTIAGDDTPQLITGTTGGATPTALAIYPGLQRSVLHTAVVTVYTPGAVNYASGYDQYYTKAITVNGFSVAPKKSQLVSHGATSSAYLYGAMNTPTTVSVMLNRSSDAALTHTDVIGVGPAGDYCFGFHKNAIAFVSRPLVSVTPGLGARSYVANFNNLAIRVVISYDATYQGHRVTVDMLCGVKTLDRNLGCVMFA